MKAHPGTSRRISSPARRATPRRPRAENLLNRHGDDIDGIFTPNES
jgi:hypothetical protein